VKAKELGGREYITWVAQRSVLIRYHFDYESAQIWQAKVLEMSKHDPSVRRPCQGCDGTTWAGSIPRHVTPAQTGVVPEYSYPLEYLTFESLPCILTSTHFALFLASSPKGLSYAMCLLSPNGLRRIALSVS
jgi:hypothetical protein